MAYEKNILENEFNLLKKELHNEKEALETLMQTKKKIEIDLDIFQKESHKDTENLLNLKNLLENELENLKNERKNEISENEAFKETLTKERDVIQKEFEHFKIESLKEKENIISIYIFMIN